MVSFHGQRKVRNGVLLAPALLLLLTLMSCATTYPKTECRTLGQVECISLQTVAINFPSRVGQLSGIVFWVAEDYDFSAIQSIYIPDFQDLTYKSADLSRELADDLVEIVSEEEKFQAVGREAGRFPVVKCTITKSADWGNVVIGEREELEVECEVKNNDGKVIAALTASVVEPQPGILFAGPIVAPIVNAIQDSVGEQMADGLSEALNRMKKGVKSGFINKVP